MPLDNKRSKHSRVTFRLDFSLAIHAQQASHYRRLNVRQTLGHSQSLDRHLLNLDNCFRQDQHDQVGHRDEFAGAYSNTTTTTTTATFARSPIAAQCQVCV